MESLQIASETPAGMPFHVDTKTRLIVDSLEESSNTIDWYPANAMTIKLWQCLEALRDIDIALESVGLQKNESKKKRQLKQFSVQLHSLATSLVRLFDQIVGDKDASLWLEKGTTAEISKIKSEFSELVPLNHKDDLSVLRNQLGAHIDSKLTPWSAHKILSSNAISHYGQWLHICLHALLDLLKLKVYSWSVHSENLNHIRLMSIEPYLVTFECERYAEIKRIAAVHLSNRSPLNTIVDIMGKIIDNSQWMFSSNVQRIRALKADETTVWNTFTGSSVIWQPLSEQP